MKLFKREQKRRRFDIFNPDLDLIQPEAVGIIPSKLEYDLGLPNLERRENVTLFGSNSSTKETLLVKLKWRPSSSGPGSSSQRLVTLTSQLYLSTQDGSCYHWQQVESYEPQRVLWHSIESGDTWRIKQYGSRASQLKLYIPTPYRRMRLVFAGHVKRIGDGASAFLRLSCVLNPLGEIFDHLDGYNEQCARQMYEAQASAKVRSFEETISGLVSHDRHDQKSRFVGEYTLSMCNEGAKSEKLTRDFVLYGFHCRQFISGATSGGQSVSPSSKRLYAFMINGQAFGIGNNKLGSDQIDFGFVSFRADTFTDAISEPFTGIDWDKQVNEHLAEFQVQVTGHGQSFTCQSVGRRAAPLDSLHASFMWFDVLWEGDTPGYALVTLDDETLDSQADLERVQKSRDACELALDDGLLACAAKPSEADKAALVVGLNEESCTKAELVGSKAASLAHLIRLHCRLEKGGEVKFKVPLGFATTERAHQQLMAQYPELSKQVGELSELAFSKPGELSDACRRLVEQVASLELPASIGEQLEAKLAASYADKPELKFAVRSSSWGEDEQDMSAAGQLSTLLNVPNELHELKRAIMACFASKFSPENIEYKRQHGLPFDLPMGVVVQQMVDCDKAGVMFTCDPTTGDPSLLTITANYGLGESVVSAQAEPDTIQVRAALDGGGHELLRVESVQVGSKQVVVSESASAQQADKSKCCVSDDEALRLARCALRVRAYFWNEQRDIEWGLFGGELYLFQSRPVTGLEALSNREYLDEVSLPFAAELNFFSRANVGEVSPYAVSTLSLTSVYKVWNVFFFRQNRRLTNEPIRFVPLCPRDACFERHHLYFSLRGSSLFSFGSGPKNVIFRAMEIGCFGREMGEQPEIAKASRLIKPVQNLYEGWRYNWMFRSMILQPMRTVISYRPICQQIAADIQANKHVPSEPRDPRRLVELLNQFSRVGTMENAWHNHSFNIRSATTKNLELSAFLSKFIQDPMRLTAASNKFLAITPDVLSAEVPARTKQLAELVAKKGRGELEKFVGMSDEQALAYVRDKELSSAEIAQKFDEFIRRFGHRCYHEFEIQSKTWREKPEQVVKMIRLNCSSKLSAPEVKLNKLKTIDQVIDSLPELKDMSLADRCRLKFRLAPKCQLLLAVREQTKDLIVMDNDLRRQASRRLAEELHRQMRIPDQELLYYLCYDELIQLCCSPQPGFVMNALRRRQLFRQNFGQQVWKYDEIFSDLTPNHLKREARAELEAKLVNAPKLHGTPASSGRVQGQVCLVSGYEELHKVRPGCILLTHSTDIAFSPVFPLISGIITQVGGLISHGAVVAREYGLPSVIGIPRVTEILEDGEEIVLDADTGTIVRLGKQQAP